MKRLLISFIFFSFVAPPAKADRYYTLPPSCPAGTNAVETTLGQVRPDLLPSYPTDQGPTDSCGIQAGMVLINSVYRLAETKETQSASSSSTAVSKSSLRPSDLSFLDGMLKCGKKDSDAPSLPYQSYMTAFLVKISQLNSLAVDPHHLTIKDAATLNLALKEQTRACKQGTCDQKSSGLKGNAHSECLNQVLKNAPADSACESLFKDFHKVIDEIDSDVPIEALTRQHRNQMNVPLPAFQIETWDLFQSKEDLQKELIAQSIAQDPILPLGLSTQYESDDNMRHAVALTAVKEIKCIDQHKKVLATFHSCSIKNSWGGTDEGPFDLVKMAEGMYKFGGQFIKIYPQLDLTSHSSASPNRNSILRFNKRSLPGVFRAAKTADTQLLETLRKSGFDPNQTAPDGVTPLQIAAR